MSKHLPQVLTATATLIISAFGLAPSQVSAAQAELNGIVNFAARTDLAVNSVNFVTVTAVDFLSPPATPNAEVVPGATGDFSVLSGQPVIFKDFTIGTPVIGEWTIPGMPGWSFDLTSSSNFSTDNLFLNIAGLGTLHAPLFNDTLGTFTLTASRSAFSQIEFSFQASTSGLGKIPPEGGVPDGGMTLVLLAGSILGIGAVHRRKA